MRLINFGPGEIADRLSILALKILYAKQARRPVEHFERERNALIPKFVQPTGLIIEHMLELGATNAGVWQGEDALRRYRQDGTIDGFTSEGLYAIAAIAFRLQELNDRRHQLISLINSNAGETTGAEKV